MKVFFNLSNAGSLSYDADHQANPQVSADDAGPLVIQFRKKDGGEFSVVIEVEDGEVSSVQKSCPVQASMSGANASMSGANTPASGVYVPGVGEEPIDEELIKELKPIFKNRADEAVAFIRRIDGARSTCVTEAVNDLLREGKISKSGCKKALWSILHRYGYYTKLNRTWNLQVNF